MIKYSEIKKGNTLMIVGQGAPGYAKLGDLVVVKEVGLDSVKVANIKGEEAAFLYSCGAERLDFVSNGNILDAPTMKGENKNE
jgi:translation elongation factor P/translation initiation factor 5A